MTAPTIRDLQSQFANLLGFRIVDWRADEARLELPDSIETRNAAGAIHGGAIAALVDMAGSMAGCFSADPLMRRKVVTLSLSVNFVGPAHSGSLYAQGRRRGGGKAVYMSTVEVTDAGGDLVATGHGVFKYVA